ncbi:MAG: glycosyltransferase 87 family protein, partial [Candidatus Omnitrophota bacterium]
VYHHRTPSNLVGGLIYFIIYPHSLWLFLIRPLMNGGADFWPESWFLENNPNIINIASWQEFVSGAGIGWKLFLLKLPYLIAEIIMVILIIKMLDAKEKKERVLNFLIFNPVSLFVIYIFGSYDIIPVLLFVLSLYFAKKEKISPAIFMLGLAVYIKVYMIFLMPLYIFIMCRDWQRRAGLALLGFLPGILVSIIAVFKGEFVSGLKFLLGSVHTDYVLALVLPSQYLSDRIYPFITAYCLIMLFILHSRTHNEKNLFLDLSGLSLALSLLFYSLCFFHPQYFLLIVPLMAFQISKDKRMQPWFFILAVCFFIYVLQWGKDLSWRLFMPLNPPLFSGLSSPSELISRVYPADKFIGIFRSIFSAACFWIIYNLLKKGEGSRNDFGNNPGIQ